MRSLLSKFRNKKELPADSTCRNCDTTLIARYCHNCGQDYFAGNERTVGEILYNTADTIFAWDNKIFKTINYLLFYPGRLTKEFYAGKVVQYVYPAKLFWFTSILFFACINLANQIKIDPSDVPGLKASFNTIEESMENEPESYMGTYFTEKIKQTTQDFDTVGSFQSKMRQNIAGNLPYVMFLLIPFFALLLFILFYKKKKYYVNHLIFAMHFHSFVFLFYTIYALISDFIPGAWDPAVTGILLFLPAVYFAVALQVVYRPGISTLLWKVPFIVFAYGTVCTITLISFVFLAAIL